MPEAFKTSRPSFMAGPPRTPDQEEVYQERAAQADLLMRITIGQLIGEWARQDAQASPDGQTIDILQVINPALSGSMGALSELAWDYAPEDCSVEQVQGAFTHQAHLSLTAMSAERTSGLMFRTEREEGCRICGCTESVACLVDGQPCHWIENDLCSNPDCVEKALAAARS